MFIYPKLSAMMKMLPKKHLRVKGPSSKSSPSTYLRDLVAPLPLSDIECGKDRTAMGQSSG